jgi:hypothetical protein
MSQVPHHEDVWANGGTAPRIINLDTNGSGYSASCPGRFTPEERGPGTNWIRGWVDPRAGLDAVVKIKKSLPLPGIEPRWSSP